jgi:hypothetical protein
VPQALQEASCTLDPRERETDTGSSKEQPQTHAGARSPKSTNIHSEPGTVSHASERGYKLSALLAPLAFGYLPTIDMPINPLLSYRVSYSTIPCQE